VMRGVVDRGTGAGIRSTYGIQADVAGKTGTTQDNTDGWFILMHPQLVAGAWVGFNDNRVRLQGDYWGQGAHSALPIVGDFFQQSLRAKLLDQRVRFTGNVGTVGPVGGSVPELQPVQPPEAETVTGPEQAPQEELMVPNGTGVAPLPAIPQAFPAAPQNERPPPLPPIPADMFPPEARQPGRVERPESVQ
jgi:penicillin-binding protein 1A